MYTRNWQVIKDDTKRTFEVCGHEASTNGFTNSVYAMQRAGMNVSCVTPPVTNKTSSEELIKLTAYTREVGLHDRLKKEYREITMGSINEYEDEEL
jgi:hypothetical protein